MKGFQSSGGGENRFKIGEGSQRYKLSVITDVMSSTENIINNNVTLYSDRCENWIDTSKK